MLLRYGWILALDNSIVNSQFNGLALANSHREIHNSRILLGT